MVGILKGASEVSFKGLLVVVETGTIVDAVTGIATGGPFGTGALATQAVESSQN